MHKIFSKKRELIADSDIFCTNFVSLVKELIHFSFKIFYETTITFLYFIPLTC